MLYFPQLSSGAAGQFPIVKRRQTRTIINSHLDGSIVKLADPVSANTEWELALSGLTTQEWNAIETLFQATEGRMATFTYLDPTDNLLKWSESLTNTAWIKGAMIQLTEGIADPAGASRATRVTNAGQTEQRIQQAISAPSWFQYCFSVYVRSQQELGITLFRSTTTYTESKLHKVGPQWNRLVSPGKLHTPEETINFGIEIGAGVTIEVFGPSVEAQPGASTYKKTSARSGIYPTARFQEDTLAVVTEGPDLHSSVMRIVGKAGG